MHMRTHVCLYISPLFQKGKSGIFNALSSTDKGTGNTHNLQEHEEVVLIECIVLRVITSPGKCSPHCP